MESKFKVKDEKITAGYFNMEPPPSRNYHKQLLVLGCSADVNHSSVGSSCYKRRLHVTRHYPAVILNQICASCVTLLVF